MKHNLLPDAIKLFGRTKPYDIQVDFMNNMLKTFDNKSIGLFESPTGTGKSLSVLCSSVAFLNEKNKDQKKHSTQYHSDSSDSDFDFMDDDAPPRSKLFVCTRTHSQIKELAAELKKFPTNLLPPTVSLASRQQLCVNTEYSKLSAAELDDKCGSKCPFYDQKKMKQFSKDIMQKPLDIEDLASYGSSHQVCPYFTCRQSIDHSDIVLLPYQSLFHAGTREALGISLKGAYIVVDEAHNLVDALNNLYTITLTDEEVKISLKKISKFRKNINKKNKTQPEEIQPNPEKAEFEEKEVVLSKVEETKFATKLINILTPINGKLSSQDPSIHKMNDFQITLRISDFNPFQVINWAKERRLVYLMCHRGKPENRVKKSQALRNFLSFVETMGYTDDMGIVTLEPSKDIPNKPRKPGKITYMLLNPSTVFTEVADEAESVILVGGTLKPFEDVIAQLCPTKTLSSIVTHSNGHVIPKENCLCMCASKGKSGERISVTYQTRQSGDILSSIASAIDDLAAVVPYGIIVFFTSFGYMDAVYDSLKINPNHKFVHDKMLLKEARSQKDLDKLMKLFKSTINNADSPKGGAILFAVINGKLSEGINFANNYCRCVMVVGMPYPDKNDIVLSQRMKFFDELKKTGNSVCDGQQFYTNLCMRAVNQSIGRSFRNINDYAAVVLFDERYDGQSQLLPQWIQRSYMNTTSWDQVTGNITQFFKKHLPPK